MSFERVKAEPFQTVRGEVLLRGWSVADLKQYMAANKSGTEIETCIALSVCDADGNRKYTDAEIPNIAAEFPGVVAFQISNEVLQREGLTKQAADAAKKD